MHNEANFRRVVESSLDAIAIQCEDKLVYVNPAGVKLLGFHRLDDLIGRSLWEFLPSRYKSIIENRCRQMELEGSQAIPIEIELSRAEGQPVDVEVTATPFRYQGKAAIQVVLHDITARKLVEDQIRRRNVELLALNAITVTVSKSLELKKILEDALEGVVNLRILGEEAQGMIFLHEEGSDALYLAAHRGAAEDHPCLQRPPRIGECLCGLAVQMGEPIISEDCYTDERHERCWANMPPHKDVCIPMKVRGNVLGVMDVRLSASKPVGESVVRLLSSVAGQIGVAIENARLFEEVRQQSERLRMLSGRIAEAEEAERRRIARKLHDQAGESLTALGINLGIIGRHLAESEDSKLQEYVGDSLGLVDQATDRIRDLMSELRPPMLDDSGLFAALRWYGRRFSDRVGIEVDVTGQGPTPRLSARSEAALFRIAVEALTNVAKHAGASLVTLDATYDEEVFTMAISDDGVGFDVEHTLHANEDRGWGLLTMLERAESIGGRFRIESSPKGGGTRVVTEVPR